MVSGLGVVLLLQLYNITPPSCGVLTPEFVFDSIREHLRLALAAFLRIQLANLIAEEHILTPFRLSVYKISCYYLAHNAINYLFNDCFYSG